ncbi:MAG TPA: hypothetical protein VN397_02715 [Candidatus Methylomirabilis sp.]|nr:hypothetical protein [Candidatus Methylomirabilis sp.]
MDPRLADILVLLVEDYIRTAEPVGSQALVKTHRLHVSPATIRNWFSDLEGEGYLLQPHTSAGRIPSESAFRWYVDERLGKPEIHANDRELLRHAAESAVDPVDAAKACARVCSSATGTAAVVGSNRADSYYTGLSELFRQPEFHDWSRVVSMSSILDRLDERLNPLRRKTFAEPMVLLGGDCPFGSACGSVILSLPEGLVFVLLGPMRMDYRKARNAAAAVADVVAH